MRKLYWEEDQLTARLDLDLRDESGRLGFFRDYKHGLLTFSCYLFAKDLTFPDITLEEAKAAVEAMIYLEG